MNEINLRISLGTRMSKNGAREIEKRKKWNAKEWNRDKERVRKESGNEITIFKMCDFACQ